MQPVARAARGITCSLALQCSVRRSSTALGSAVNWRQHTPPPIRRLYSTDGNGKVPSSPADVPWYLRVDVPQHPTLVPEDQTLPPIPPGSPALMEPLVRFVADDLGMDALALLDLRDLDPPAALGPDLLMLFGTARSDRHLHVSAGRLVRWLRERGIHATADGLMGRNELKIKLRRKARRAKMMNNLSALASASAVESGGDVVVDDGIATQWVCLQAAVQGGRQKAQNNDDEGQSVVDSEGRTTGFGSVRPCTMVVVQMLTEAKRRQLDLESLWGRVLVRSQRRRAADDEPMLEDGEATDLVDNLDERLALSPSAVSRAPTLSMSGDAQTAHNPLHQQQSRSFSASIRCTAPSTGDTIVATLTEPPLDHNSLGTIHDALAADPGAKARLLEHLLAFLDGLDKADEMRRTLGLLEGPNAASEFVRVAQYCMRDLLAAETCMFRARVHAKLAATVPDRFPLAGLAERVHELELSGKPVARPHYLRLLHDLLAVPCRSDVEREQQAHIALRLLNMLRERGEAVMANDILVAMVTALARVPRNDDEIDNHIGDYEPYDFDRAPPVESWQDLADVMAAALQHATTQQTRGDAPAPTATVSAAHEHGVGVGLTVEETRVVPPVQALQTALERLMRQMRLPCPDEAELRQLMTAYAHQNDWDRFWAAWRWPAQHGRRRSEALYAFLYEQLAATRHRGRCTEALRTCVPEMLHEQPPVALEGSVWWAFLTCIDVADPKARMLARSVQGLPGDVAENDWKRRLMNREFVRLLLILEAKRR